MVVLIIGVIVLVVGGALMYFGRRTQAKTNLMRAVATANAAELSNLLPGEMVELKGTIRCASPLMAEYVNKACVWYSATMTREYEHREKDSDGHWETNRRSETVSSNTQHTPFFVQDATGQTQVDLTGAEIDAPVILDRFEDKPSGGNSGPSISIGGISISGGGGGDKTLGYRYNVKALEIDKPVYVLGVYREDGTVGAPPEGSKTRKFIVSHRSEEDLSASWRKHAYRLGLAAIACALIGAILIVVGIALLVV
ncbi:MAG TPA: E3 ubiquitin ligase family protein [Nitrolancea sp.]|nr:E3 ubiquitin ligase family protein [Nitrolancea sp.]